MRRARWLIVGLFLAPLLAAALAVDNGRPAQASGTAGIPYECGWFDDSNLNPLLLYTPTALSGLTDATSVAVGDEFALALRSDGTVWGWGYNDMGVLGMGPNVVFNTETAVQVPGLSNITAIAAEWYSAAALRSDGTVWTWGGDGQPRGSGVYQPLQVPGLSGIVAVGAGSVSFEALKSDGTVWTWGSNGAGELGNGTIDSTGSVEYPAAAVPGLTGITAVSAGAQHDMALRNDGTLWVWGDDYYGELGLGTVTASQPSPVQVPGLRGVTAIDAGWYHSLAILGGGTLYDWGSNEYGELGDGSLTNQAVPAAVPGLGPVRAVSAGEFHTMAFMTDGSLRAWGYNQDGELCLGQTASGPFTSPQVVPGASGVAGIGLGRWASLILVASPGDPNWSVGTPVPTYTPWPTPTPTPTATATPTPTGTPTPCHGRRCRS